MYAHLPSLRAHLTKPAVSFPDASATGYSDADSGLVKVPEKRHSVAPSKNSDEIEGDAGEECWCSLVPCFKFLCVLVMRKTGTARVKTAKEELDERSRLPRGARTRSKSSTSGYSMTGSERREQFDTRTGGGSSSGSWKDGDGARLGIFSKPSLLIQAKAFKVSHTQITKEQKISAGQQNVTPTLARLPVKIIFRPYHRTHAIRSCILLESGLVISKQTFTKAEQCFGLNDGEDDDSPSSLHRSLSLNKVGIMIQHCHAQIEVDIQGAIRMVMALGVLKLGASLCRPLLSPSRQIDPFDSSFDVQHLVRLMKNIHASLGDHLGMCLVGRLVNREVQCLVLSAFFHLGTRIPGRTK
ncbi:hypothetical protein F5146DRAFT_1002366 [Armillaria mellea]|nr:hypothetical protein F5146DRAFT_1002366 [Armillaria mellea]